jgi:hypothetical protein
MELADFAPYLNEYFVHYLLDGETREGYIERISFLWGTSGAVARDALINLFEHSSTTLEWSLICDYNENKCRLGIGPLKAWLETMKIKILCLFMAIEKTINR